MSAKLTEISGRIKNTAYQEIENKRLGELMGEWLLVFKKSSVTSVLHPVSEIIIKSPRKEY